MIGRSWRNNWARVIPFFQFPEEIRRVIYTTNVVESLNYSLRKIINSRSLFPNHEAVFKLLYLALKSIERKWTMPIREWKRALQQFAIVFEGRMPLP
jgi:putative transposase